MPFTNALGIRLPAALIFDGAGNLYVANGNETVTVYAPGSGKVLRTISKGIGNDPDAMAFGP